MVKKKPKIEKLKQEIKILDILRELKKEVIGQDGSLERIVPYVEMFLYQLNWPNKPISNIMLMGYTGTGKTWTPQALAKVLHGSEKAILRIDCAEFQAEHEVAKLIGAPPGYLGFKDSKPWLSQEKITAASSENCGISIVVFDEIEKASDSLFKLLLGILDTGQVRLGNGDVASFHKSIIFITSNLGVSEMKKNDYPTGFSPGKLTLNERIAINAAKKKYSPEFINRLDEILVYESLSLDSFEKILDIQLNKLNSLPGIQARKFKLEFDKKIREFLLKLGVSPDYGARELSRIIQNKIQHNLVNFIKTFDPGEIKNTYNGKIIIGITVNKNGQIVFKIKNNFLLEAVVSL